MNDLRRTKYFRGLYHSKSSKPSDRCGHIYNIFNVSGFIADFWEYSRALDSWKKFNK